MARRKLIPTAMLLTALASGFLAWHIRGTRVRAAKLEAQILSKLTAEEVSLLLKGQSHSEPQAVVAMRGNAELRQGFLKKLRGSLALAAQARREGLAEDSGFKVNLEYKKNILLDGLYVSRLSKEQLERHYRPEALDAVWADPENERRFAADMEVMRTLQKTYAASRGSAFIDSKLEGERLNKVRKYWARVKVSSDRAKADAEFMRTPEVQLRLKIVEAGILASDYLNKVWPQRVKATEAEIAAYLAAHPEYDLHKKRDQAALVLRRALAGEDFGKLAAEFSEDRTTKNKGGLYEKIKQDHVWAEVEIAALSLAPGQVADRLIESSDGFHIVKFEDKQTTRDKNGGEKVTFSVRHILFQKAFPEPWVINPQALPAFLEPREIAKTLIEKEKYDRLIDEIAGRNKITLPGDFPIELLEGVADQSTGIKSTPELKAKSGEDTNEQATGPAEK